MPNLVTPAERDSASEPPPPFGNESDEAVHEAHRDGRRRHRAKHRRRRPSLPKIRMRFAWWHLGVALLSIALGGWLVLSLQPWHNRPEPVRAAAE